MTPHPPTSPRPTHRPTHLGTVPGDPAALVRTPWTLRAGTVELTVRGACASDLSAVAALHHRCSPTSLLYRFGRVVGANNTATRWNGVGIGATAGTPVRAAAPGRVAVAQSIGSYGQTVILEHEGGDYSVYGSLARVDVHVGESVERGQTLGAVGASDPDLPAHLHFELRPQGRAVDPLGLLGGR